MLPKAAQAEAIATLREAMAVYEDHWPGIPVPAVNECEIDGIDGVQFTYLAVVKRPRDPREFQRAMNVHWRAAGYEVIPIQSESGTEAGTTYDATIRKENVPRLAYSASSLLLGLYVDSQCAEGVPDDFRPQIW